MNSNLCLNVGSSGNNNGGSISTSEAPPLTTTTESGNGGGGGEVVCSDPNGLYGHPNDCQKYYQCAHGTPYEYTCAAGLLWNDSIKACDWAANVSC